MLSDIRPALKASHITFPGTDLSRCLNNISDIYVARVEDLVSVTNGSKRCVVLFRVSSGNLSEVPTPDVDASLSALPPRSPRPKSYILGLILLRLRRGSDRGKTHQIVRRPSLSEIADHEGACAYPAVHMRSPFGGERKCGGSCSSVVCLGGGELAAFTSRISRCVHF